MTLSAWCQSSSIAGKALTWTSSTWPESLEPVAQPLLGDPGQHELRHAQHHDQKRNDADRD